MTDQIMELANELSRACIESGKSHVDNTLFSPEVAYAPGRVWAELQTEVARVREELRAANKASVLANAELFDVKRELDKSQANLAALEAQEPVEIIPPTWHQEGMGCGLEDRNITDRYDAMEYGWSEAIRRYTECLPEKIYLAAGARL